VLLKSPLDSIVSSGCHEIEMRVAASILAGRAEVNNSVFAGPSAMGRYRLEPQPRMWVVQYYGSISAETYRVTVVMSIG
jgi:hypothetical protein